MALGLSCSWINETVTDFSFSSHKASILNMIYQIKTKKKRSEFLPPFFGTGENLGKNNGFPKQNCLY